MNPNSMSCLVWKDSANKCIREKHKSWTQIANTPYICQLNSEEMFGISAMIIQYVSVRHKQVPAWNSSFTISQNKSESIRKSHDCFNFALIYNKYALADQETRKQYGQDITSESHFPNQRPKTNLLSITYEKHPSLLWYTWKQSFVLQSPGCVGQIGQW